MAISETILFLVPKITILMVSAFLFLADAVFLFGFSFVAENAPGNKSDFHDSKYPQPYCHFPL